MMLEAEQITLAILGMGCVVRLFALALHVEAGMDSNQLVNVSDKVTTSLSLLKGVFAFENNKPLMGLSD